MPATESVEPVEFYVPGISVQDFHDDPHFVRVLIGGRGSGKTFGLAADITRHIWCSAGSKAIVARKTETSQAGSTIDTFLQYFEKMGDLYQEAGGMPFFKSWNDGLTFRLPSRLAVEKFNAAGCKTVKEAQAWMEREGERLCGYIEMKGLPHISAGESKLRGMECSYLALVEADQIERRYFDLSLACLRWKGSDPETCDENGFILDKSVVLDTNPPGTKHWIAQMEAEEAKKPEHDRQMKFWHIKTEENIHNLPDNYIRDQILLPYANNPAMISRMRDGIYADAYDGNPVLFAYRPECHEQRNLGWPRGATLVVGMDVGTLNTSIISAFIQKGGFQYWWVMREIILVGSDTERQCIELLKVLSNEFPWWNKGGDICSQTLFFCDPAAANSNFSTGATSSSTKVMNTHGIFPGTKMFERGLQPTIAVMNRLLQQNHVIETSEGLKTIWHFKIDPDRCPMLRNAMAGEYRYPSEGEVGYGDDKPLKGALCNHADHPVDGLRYSCCNVLDIARESHTEGMRAKARAYVNLEPKRSI